MSRPARSPPTLLSRCVTFLMLSSVLDLTVLPVRRRSITKFERYSACEACYGAFPETCPIHLRLPCGPARAPDATISTFTTAKA
jgi:hypothetical protein